MKKLFLLIITVFVLFSCQRTISDSTHDNNTEQNAPPASGAPMMIVKFADNEQKNNVIVGHLIKGILHEEYIGYNHYYFHYDEESGLSLNIYNPEEEENLQMDWNDPTSDNQFHFFSATPAMAVFLEKEAHLREHSPYIPLADGYYLVEWRWAALLPMTAALGVCPKEVQEDIIYNHCFTTDIPWNDLEDLTQVWDNARYPDPVCLEDMRFVEYEVIDNYYKEPKTEHPFIAFNWTLYGAGLSASAVYQYYCHRDNNQYKDFIAYCDSLQNVYVHHLTDIIQSGNLNKVGY